MVRASLRVGCSALLEPLKMSSSLLLLSFITGGTLLAAHVCNDLLLNQLQTHALMTQVVRHQLHEGYDLLLLMGKQQQQPPHQQSECVLWDEKCEGAQLQSLAVLPALLTTPCLYEPLKVRANNVRSGSKLGIVIKCRVWMCAASTTDHPLPVQAPQGTCKECQI